METTVLSTKGQIVIPESVRRGFAPGTAFSVTKVNELVVLKPVPNLTAEEQKELTALSKAWKEIDSGKAKQYDEATFFAQLKKW